MNEIKRYLEELNATIANLDTNSWDLAAEILLDAYRNNKSVWIAGNGGNLANSMHYATDWSKGLYVHSGKALHVQSLSENISTASAFANDIGFVEQYSNHLRMVAKPEDILVLLTAGGGSLNILTAAETATQLGLKIIGLTGGIGMVHTQLFDVHIHINSHNIQLVEDIHAIFGHSMLKYLMSSIPATVRDI